MQLAGARRPKLRSELIADGGDQRTIEFGFAGLSPAADAQAVRPRAGQPFSSALRVDMLARVAGPWIERGYWAFMLRTSSVPVRGMRVIYIAAAENRPAADIRAALDQALA